MFSASKAEIAIAIKIGIKIGIATAIETLFPFGTRQREDHCTMFGVQSVCILTHFARGWQRLEVTLVFAINPLSRFRRDTISEKSGGVRSVPGVRRAPLSPPMGGRVQDTVPRLSRKGK